ncbi:MAG: tape measure protein [Microcoleus sp.]
MKTPTLNLKINPDLKAAVAEIKGLGKTVGPVKIQAQLDLQKTPALKIDVSAGANLGAIAAQRFLTDTAKIRVGFDLKQLEEAGDKLSGKLADSIAKASRGGGFGGILGAIGQAATAPLRVATDAIGATLTGTIFGITRELTTDLGKGIRKSIEDAAGGTIGSTELLGRKASDALFEGIRTGKIDELPALLESKLSNTPKIAAVARKMAQAYVDNFSEGLKAKTERLGTAIAAIVPREDRLVASGSRTQAQRAQTASDRTQAQEAIFEQRRELGRRIQQRGEEIPRTIAQIDAAVEATKADADFQKQVRDLRRRIDRLKKTKTDDFDAGQKDDLKFAIADLTNQYARLVKPLADAAQRRQELQQELVGLNAQRAKLIQDYKLLGGREERRSALFEEGAKLSTEAKQVQSDLAKQKELLVKNTKLQTRLFRDLAKADDSRKAAITQQYNQTVAFADAIKKSVGILEDRNKTLTGQIERLSQQYKAIPAKTPKTVQDIASQLAGNAGIQFDPENLPTVVKGSNATLGIAGANYVPQLNSIILRDELFEAVQQGLELTPQQKRIIAEEVAHSLQIDLGSFKGVRNFEKEKSTNRVYSPTAEDVDRLTPELEEYAKIGESQDIIRIELEAKAAADNFVASTQSIEQQAKDLNQFQQRFGQLGDKLKRLLGFDVSSGKNKIAELLPLAEAQGSEAVNQLRDLEKLLDTIDQSSADVFRQITSAQIGVNPNLNIKASEEYLKEQVRRSTDAREKIAQVEQSLQPPGAIAQVAQKLEPAGGIVLKGAQMAGGALETVAKAGLALADKIGFAATSFIPGGALLYDPVIKPVAKTAAVGGALAAASATVPGAAEILGTITSAISTILTPATGGLAEGIGASVSADIVGALPHLFQQLSGAIASSGLPGSEMSAQAVNAIGGQLTHVLQPMVQGVASTADGAIVAVGHSVQSFLSELGTILVAGKGVETGVKLATNENARAAALQGVQTVGEGVGQFVNAVPEAIATVQDAVERTSRAVQKNVEEIKDAGARVAQGEIKAVNEIVESGTQAASNIARGASDVAKASTKAAQDIVEGAGKVGGVFGKLASQNIPGINDLGELSKDALINVYQQLSRKLENVLNAEIEAISRGNAAGTGRSSVLKGDLGRVANALKQKYQYAIEVAAEEIVDEPLALPGAKLTLPELDAVEVKVEKPTEPLKAKLENPQGTTITIPASSVEVVDEPVAITKRSDDPRDIYAAQIKLIDESIDSTEKDIREYYADLAKATKDYKEAIKKGSESGAQSAQDAARKASTALFKEINETSQDLKNVIESLASIGIDLAPTDPIRDRIQKLNAEIESKRKLANQRVAQVGISAPGDDPASLAALDLSNVSNTKQKSALKDLIDRLQKIAKEAETAKIPSNVSQFKPIVNAPELTEEQRAAEFEEVEKRRLVRQFQKRERENAKEAQRIAEFEAKKRDEEIKAFQQKEEAIARGSANILKERRTPIDLSAENAKKLEELEQKQIKKLESERLAIDEALKNPAKSTLPNEIQKNVDRADKAIQDLERQVDDYVESLAEATRKQEQILEQRSAKRRARLQADIDKDDENRLADGAKVGPTGRRFVVGPTGQAKEEKILLPGDIQSESQKANLEAKRILESTQGPIKGPDLKESRALLKKIRDDEVRFNLALEAMEEEVRQLEAGGGSGGGKGGLLGRGISGSGGGTGGPLNTIKRIGDGLKQLAVDAGVPLGPLGKLGGIVKGVGVAALAYVAVNSLGDAVVQAGKAAFDTAINMERLQTRLEFTASGPAAAAKEMEFLRSQSEKLQLPLQGLTASYAQFALASKNTAVEGGRTREAFEGLTTASRVYGLSQDQLTRVTEQVGQGFRKQRVDTEDLKTIAEGGIPIFDALSRSMGKSGTELQKSIEAGEVTSVKLADALKLVGDEAKGGLTAAMATGATAIDSLRKKIEDLQIAIGPTVVEGFKIVAAGVVAGIDLMQDAGERLAPVFGAIGEAVKLVGAVAVPIFSLLGTAAVGIGKDLLTGFAIPFEAIRGGLAELTKTVEFGFGLMSQAVQFANKQMGGLLDSVPILKAIADNANPATLAIQGLGFALGVLAVAQTVSFVAGIGKAVVALGALRLASLAFLITPLGITLTAIGVAAAAAYPHIDEMARAVSGLSEAELRSNERSIEFTKLYTQGLTQLQKGIPLTASELKKLKYELALSAEHGIDGARTFKVLTENLDKLQANAEAAALIQGKLAKAMTDSTKAIKLQSNAIDAEYTTRSSGLNEALANQAITRERFDQEELDAQQEKTKKYLELYDTQAEGLSASLSMARAQLAQPMPQEARNAVVKQVEELQDKLNEIEEKRGQQRIQLAQNQQKVIEKIEADRVKRAENQQKVVENQVAAGVQPQIDGEIELSNLKQKELNRRIKLLDQQISAERISANELTDIGENLFSERQVLESELTKVVADEAQKRYEYYRGEFDHNLDLLNTAIQQSEAEGDTALQTLLNNRLITQKQYDERKLRVTSDRLRKELALEQTNLKILSDLPSPSNPEIEREHQKAIRDSRLKTAQLTQQLAEQEYQEIQKTRELAMEAIDERVKSFGNAITEIGQATETIDTVNKLITDGIERQNKLLESRKALSASIAGLAEQEYKILIDSEKDEGRKAKLQEQAAVARLKSLRDAQAIEREIFELQLKQEQIQSRLAITKAQANVFKQEAEAAKAKAEEEKVLADPNATDADKRAASLGVQSAQLGSVAAAVELEGLIDADKLREALVKSRREVNNLNDRKDLLGSRYELAQSRTDPDLKEKEIAQLQKESRLGLRSRVGLNNGVKPDYSQVDVAARQLGLLPQGVNLGALLARKQPVDLHSGANSPMAQLSNLNGEFKRLADLTSSGVVGNLTQLVQLQQNLAVQLQSLASKPRLDQTINNYNSTRRSPILAGSGL